MPRHMIAQWTSAQMDRDQQTILEAGRIGVAARASTLREALEHYGVLEDKNQRRLVLVVYIADHHREVLRRLMAGRILIAWSDGTLEVR